MSNSGGILKESDTEVVERDMKVKIVDKENPDKMKEKGAKKVKSATLPRRNNCYSVKSGRTPLRSLQPHSTQRGVLPGAVTSHLLFTCGEGKKTSKKGVRETPSPDTEDFHKCRAPCERTSCDKEVQTESQIAEKTVDYRMCTDKEPPVEYWQILAEQRRQALAEALTENEELYAENEELRQKIIELERRLESKDYFAMMYKLASDDNSQS